MAHIHPILPERARIRAELAHGLRECAAATGAAIGCCVCVAAVALLLVGVWG